MSLSKLEAASVHLMAALISNGQLTGEYGDLCDKYLRQMAEYAVAAAQAILEASEASAEARRDAK